ncbi:unnamed protein product [Notodromas monacha]|uniref:carbonic anhydrase n=1 Tax=Notodromas monacha TaxID=399045 RepID=A0A7R9BR12_9CRUS|nr:unnamed protein product [Notodromas monacha]CAG0919181.1 unnamed protein product [Notodromas monacha]
MFSLTAVKAFVTLALMTASWVEVVTSLEHVVSLTGDDTENPDFASRCVDSDQQEGRPVVEIDFDNARSFPQYEELDMEGLFKPLGDFQIIREPSQVKLIMPFDKDQSDQTPIMSGGELFGSYKLREVRIVWGRKNTLSSRHILAGERFPLEMHMIHQKVPLNKYSIRDIHQPMTDLAVIAVLFEESPKTSATFSNLVSIILGGKNESGGMQVTLGKMFPQDVDVFFRYEELMMDPSCQAHVSWTVFPTPARLPVKETLYKPGDGTESSKSIVDKEYVLNVDVRLMSPRQSAEMIPGLMAPPDLHHRPAYALIPPPQHDPYSDALDHRGINVYHVYQESLHHGDDQESPLEAVKISPKGEPGK